MSYESYWFENCKKKFAINFVRICGNKLNSSLFFHYPCKTNLSRKPNSEQAIFQKASRSKRWICTVISNGQCIRKVWSMEERDRTVLTCASNYVVISCKAFEYTWKDDETGEPFDLRRGTTQGKIGPMSREGSSNDHTEDRA